MSIKESDWKALRKLHETALERFCERVLVECRELSADRSVNAHERYLLLFEFLRDRNEDIARAFDDMRRSRAVERLVAMLDLGVVTDEELREFSPEMRREVERLQAAR